MEYINTRTLARLAAVQGLYQYAMTNSNKAVIISKIINYYKNSEQVKKDFNIQVPIITKLNTFYFNKLLTSTFNNLITVDQIIQSNLSPDFKFDGQKVFIGNIIVRQRGTKIICWTRATIFAMKDGKVKFMKTKNSRVVVSVVQ